MKTKSHRRKFLKQGALLGGSLLLLGPKAQPSRAAGNGTSPPANETLKTIRNLRTIHGNFLDQPLPESVLATILQASVRAANASNMQSYSIVVVKDRKKMKEVCTYQGSCMLLYCADFNRLKACAGHLGHPYFPDNLTNFVTASINTALAAQTAAIAARSLGLDYLITNGIHRGDMERVWKLLELPPTHCFPLIALILGYPTEEPKHQKGRLDGAGIIHHEKYQPLTEDEIAEIIRQTDDDRLHLALDFSANRKAEGYDHYLDWYFKAWAADNARPTEQETQMLRLLKRSGFVEPQKA